MGVRVTKSRKDSKKFVQSRLQLGASCIGIVKCPKCEMAYSPSSFDDVNTHKIYHDLQLKGRKWSSSWGVEIHCSENEEFGMLTPPSSASKSNNNNLSEDHIVMIRPDSTAEVKATMQLLDVVNDELNAPHDENDFWSRAQGHGKAFVYVKNKRAIGIVTIEVLEPDRGRWMIYNTKSIVEHVRPSFSLGISRIWVCRTERSFGVATKLLEAARENTIYGKNIERWQIAWSQPTESGGKLACKYNGRKHKSGKLLLPCYI